MLTNILLSALPLIPIYMGIYLVFVLRNDFDLTLDGTFAWGGGVVAMALTSGIPASVGMGIGVFSGGLLGIVTALIHSRFRIPVFLAGLLMSIALYTLTVRIMGKQTTLSLIGEKPIFDSFPFPFSGNYDLQVITVLTVAALATLLFVGWFLKTEVGLAMRAAGINPLMARTNGISDKWQLAVALFIANSLAAFSGALVVQTQGFADVSMGSGVVLAGLGGVIIGALITRPTSSKVGRICAAVVVGTLLYQAMLIAALRLGIDPIDLHLVTAAILLGAIGLQQILRNVNARRRGISNSDDSVVDMTGGISMASSLSDKE